MQHLDEAELVDALDGRPTAASLSHLGGCPDCEARLLDLRAAMQAVIAADDQFVEPSPSFWDHFPRRVNRALDEAPAPRAWFQATRWVWGSAAAAILLLMMLLPLRDGPVISPQDPAAEGPAVIASADGAEDFESFKDFENDDAWAVVRAVAEDLDYEEVRDAGLIPRAGSVERAAVELSADERAELARLIEQELKRTGASTP